MRALPPQTRALGLAIGLSTCTAISLVSTRSEADTTKLQYNPYVAGRFSDSTTAADVGVEAYPLTNGVGGRLILSGGKGDPSETQGAASTEKGRLGLKGQIIAEFGPSSRDALLPSKFGLAFMPEWSVNRYSFNPKGGAKETETFHSWKAGLWLWWFGGVGAAAVGPGPAPDAGGTGKLPEGGIKATNVQATLIHPQVRFTYARTFKEQDDSFVVRAAGADGLQLAEKLKITSPSAKPTLTVLAALPIQPSGSKFAFGPAAAWTFTGVGDKFDPFGNYSRLRIETWLYYFVFDAKASESPAVRVGVAPFVDIRTAGDDKRDSLIAGALFELRTSTSKIEY